MHTYRNTGRQASRNTDNQTNRQAGRHTNVNKLTDWTGGIEPRVSREDIHTYIHT